MLSGLEVVFAVTALLAGATGSWSPCGFSMIETLGGHGHDRRTAVAACVTFTVGTLVGGPITFAGLALLGGLAHGVSPAAGVAVAAAVAGGAALAELAGVRIVPQIRRQVPEPWRRVMPVPVAGGLYGVLLGLGFTTFVLTFAVWALAGISVALGDARLGIVVGLAFGIGRALPVVAVAPFLGTRFAAAVLETMAERPLVLRGLRLADGTALAVCAVALAGGGAAAAATTTVASPATDPTAAGADLAWSVPGGNGVLARRGRRVPLPGSDPALGGGKAAWRDGDLVTVADRATLRPLFARRVAGVNKLAVNDRWVVYRRDRAGGGDEIGRFPVGSPNNARVLARSRGSTVLGRPSVSGDRAVFHSAGTRRSAIVSVDLRSRRSRTVLSSRTTQVLNPSLLGRRLAYVASSKCGQQLRLARSSGRRPRVVLRRAPLARRDTGHDPGHTTQGRRASLCPNGARGPSTDVLWTTALSRTGAFVTRIRRRSGTPAILRVAR